jgi:hypothetical protein
VSDRETRIRQRIEVGREAEVIRENPALAAYFDAVERQVVEKWQALDSAATLQDHMFLQLSLGTIRGLRANLAMAVSDGERAEAELDALLTPPSGRQL